MKDKKIHFILRALQIVFIFSTCVVLLQVYLYYALPDIVTKYTQQSAKRTTEYTLAEIKRQLPEIIAPYIEENNKQLAESIASKYSKEVETKLGRLMQDSMAENNTRLTNSISDVLAQNTLNTRTEVKPQIEKYFTDLLQLQLPGQTKAVLQNPEDIVIFEFLDYQCGFCKRLYVSLKTLRETHDNVVVKYIDYPILGNMSFWAAILALKASEQGSYHEIHDALMQHKGRLTQTALQNIAIKVGLEANSLEKNIKNTDYINTIRGHLELGQKFGVKGTPYSLIISLNKNGDIVGEEINGYVNSETLARLVQKYTDD